MVEETVNAALLASFSDLFMACRGFLAHLCSHLAETRVDVFAELLHDSQALGAYVCHEVYKR